MILELLGGGAGLLTPIVTQVFGFFKNKQEHKQKIELLNLENQADREAEKRALERVVVEARSKKQSDSLEYDSKNYSTSIKHDKAKYVTAEMLEGCSSWVRNTVVLLLGLVDWARGFVRPSLTVLSLSCLLYGWFLGIELEPSLTAICYYMVGFWFGDRSLNKKLKR